MKRLAAILAALVPMPASADSPCRLTDVQWAVLGVADTWDEIQDYICEGVTQQFYNNESYWLVMRWPVETPDGTGLGAIAFDEAGNALERYWDPTPTRLADGTLRGIFFGPLQEGEPETSTQ